MDNWISRFRSAKTAEGFDRVLVPGDPEREIEAERKEHGIPLVEAVVADLKALGDKLHVPFPA
jgi:LDH2 family malate/lactate/ureidoglycolate dehydrogenase